MLLLLLPATLLAQVKIGGAPATPPHPTAVLHLDDSTKGLLLPVVKEADRNALASPPNGLLLYNKTSNQLNLYNNGWNPVNTDTSEWKFDPATKRVNLSRSYAIGDTIFYDTLRHKFLFSDKLIYTNSFGSTFSALNFFGKYTFKTTASKSSLLDTITLANNNIYSIYEVDNAPADTNDIYTSANIVATVNPKALQKISSVTGMSSAAIHAGQDTVFRLYGINNVSTVNGNGYMETLYGISNVYRINTGATKNTGSMFGIYNFGTAPATSVSRVDFNVYGYYGFMSNALLTKTLGTAYGIFLGNVNGAQNGNYAIYTNAGKVRFGDSVSVGISTTPRAIFDVNSTSAMMIPTGNNAQRPATGLWAGMTRYNVESGGYLETYNGSSWIGTIRLATTIDIPSLAVGSAFVATITVPGATVGSAVAVSPVDALSTGLVIAYARVSLANTVEIRFNLTTGITIDPPAQTYIIRVIQ